MLKNLYLLKFNNYANRIIKYPRQLEEYNNSILGVIENINFNPSDGISTSQIINYNGTDPDYILVVNQADNSIDSRWFVIHSTRTRAGQFQLSLKRDTIADNYEAVLNSTCYIEKGWLNSTSSLIYQKEDFQANQIKLGQHLIKDYTIDGCKFGPWYVAYLPRYDGAGNLLKWEGYFKNKAENTIVDITLSTFVQLSNLANNSSIPQINHFSTNANESPNKGSIYIPTKVIIATPEDGKNVGFWRTYYNRANKSTGYLDEYKYDRERGYYRTYNFEATSTNVAFATSATANKSQALSIMNRVEDSEDYLQNVNKVISSLLSSTYEDNVTNIRRNSYLNTYDKGQLEEIIATYCTSGVLLKYNNRFFKFSCSKRKVFNASEIGFNYSIQSSWLNRWRINATKAGYFYFSDQNGNFKQNVSLSYNYMPLITYSSDFAQKFRQFIGTGAIDVNQIIEKRLDSVNSTPIIYTNQNINNADFIPTQCGGILLNEIELYNFELEEISDISANNDIRSYGFKWNGEWDTPSDAPYDIIAAPACNIYTKLVGTNRLYRTSIPSEDSNGWQLINSNQQANAWMQQLASGIQGGETVYKAIDIQIVPYINFEDIFLGSQNGYPIKYNPIYLKTDLLSINEGHVTHELTTPYYAFALRLNASSATMRLKFEYNDENAVGNLNIPNIANMSDLEIKSSNNLDLYRLRSPGGSSEYDFSIVKNGGLTGFIVDYTLLPFNPYYNICPEFSNLYGQNFDKDYRGLLMHDDYSMAVTTNEWASYQMANKNYQAMFNRSIESMDIQYKWARNESILNVASGVVGAAISGASTGAAAGPVGAIAGGVLGAGASALGGAFDLKKQEEIYKDQRGAAVDQFNFNVGNIQARQQSLARSTGYNIDNTYFPVLEYYSCTEAERNIFNNLISYSGMIVKSIGTLSQYLTTNLTYSPIRASIVEIDIDEDSHYVYDINIQLNSGIRIEFNPELTNK